MEFLTNYIEKSRRSEDVIFFNVFFVARSLGGNVVRRMIAHANLYKKLFGCSPKFEKKFKLPACILNAFNSGLKIKSSYGGNILHAL
jgi:hypothetical protein